ncbi:MAG: MFS transporter [Nitrospinae bacterium]|nr:MFS transporter [Nitrospinota bacterium]
MRHLGRRPYDGWFVLAAVSGINFANGATSIAVLTVFLLPLTEAFGWTRTQISAVTAIGAVLGALAAPFTGRLTDSKGARLPLTLGGLFIVLATLNLAAMQSLSGFYLAFGLARLADQGFVQVPSPPAVAKWFQRYRGRAMAVLFFSASAGGVVLPLLVQLVITVWHWRMAWVMLSGIMLVMGFLPCALLVRRQPEDLGVHVDGESPSEQGVITPPPPGDETPAAQRSGEVVWSLKDALKTPALWLLLTVMFIFGVASTGVGLHLVPYLVQQGIAPAAAVGAVSISFLGSGAGNLMWGFGAERLSVRYLLVGAYALRATSLALLLVIDTTFVAYIFAILKGFTEGGLSTLTTVLLANYYGRRQLGSIYGLTRSVQVAGFALGPLISGAAFDTSQSYRTAFVSFFALSILATGLIWLARQPLKKQRDL